MPGGIGITGTFGLEGLHTHNDRIIHDWLTYAGRYDVKTVDRHLSAIRYCEGLLAGKPFSKLTRDDVAKVRNDLKRRAESGAADSLSSSSIKHIVSHLSAFLDWLLKQDGFKSLPQDMQGYQCGHLVPCNGQLRLHHRFDPQHVGPFDFQMCTVEDDFDLRARLGWWRRFLWMRSRPSIQRVASSRSMPCSSACFLEIFTSGGLRYAKCAEVNCAG